MRINVYQVNEDRDKRNLIFRDYETAVEKGGVDPSEYGKNNSTIAMD